MNKLNRLEENIKKAYKGRYEFHFHHSKGIVIYEITLLEMQHGGGLEVSEGWNAFDGKSDIKVVPMKMRRSAYSASDDDPRNCYEFKSLVAMSSDTYKLVLEDGTGAQSHLMIDFSQGSSVLKEKISHAERTRFRGENNISFPGINPPRTWPKRFTLPDNDEMEQTIRRQFGADSEELRMIRSEEFAAFTVKRSIYQSGSWQNGLVFKYNAIYAIRAIDGMAIGKLIAHDIGKSERFNLPGHVAYYIREISKNTLKYEIEVCSGRIDFETKAREFDLRSIS